MQSFTIRGGFQARQPCSKRQQMHCTTPWEQGPALAFFRKLLLMTGNIAGYLWGGSFSVRPACGQKHGVEDPPPLVAPTGTQRCRHSSCKGWHKPHTTLAQLSSASGQSCIAQQRWAPTECACVYAQENICHWLYVSYVFRYFIQSIKSLMRFQEILYDCLVLLPNHLEQFQSREMKMYISI